MPLEVDFLGGFNVLYRKETLNSVGGFDERDVNGSGSPGAEDCDLSFRIHQSKRTLHFERDSLVGHHHPCEIQRYLRSQRIHGHWRVRLYRRHLGRMGGDSYTGKLDHFQPLLGLLMIAGLPLSFIIPRVAMATVLICGALNFGCGVTIARRLDLFAVFDAPAHRRFTPTYLHLRFCIMSVLRSISRAAGIMSGVASCITRPPSGLPRSEKFLRLDTAASNAPVQRNRLEENPG